MVAIIVTIPLLLVCVFVGINFGGERYLGWKKDKVFYENLYRSTLEQKGEDYIEFLVNKGSDTVFRYLRDDEELQFSEYLRYIYVDDDTYTSVFYADLTAAIISVGGGLFFLIATLGIRREAPLIFDRENGLVKSWQNGKIYAIAWEDLRIGLHPSGIGVILPRIGQIKGDQMVLRYILRAQNFSFHMDEDRDLWPLLTRICDYMEGGLEAASLECFENKPVFALRQQERPKDFDAALTDRAAIKRATLAQYGEEFYHS
ncbi:hypothetical protein [Thioclava sp. GXIMD4215]|uniref:hypothetical protein n=1 Tax=Thioclava sp. GXIMD4215 TaxID=3131928 RepID=UPI00311ABEEC